VLKEKEIEYTVRVVPRSSGPW